MPSSRRCSSVTSSPRCRTIPTRSPYSHPAWRRSWLYGHGGESKMYRRASERNRSSRVSRRRRTVAWVTRSETVRLTSRPMLQSTRPYHRRWSARPITSPSGPAASAQIATPSSARADPQNGSGLLREGRIDHRGDRVEHADELQVKQPVLIAAGPVHLDQPTPLKGRPPAPSDDLPVGLRVL